MIFTGYFIQEGLLKPVKALHNVCRVVENVTKVIVIKRFY